MSTEKSQFDLEALRYHAEGRSGKIEVVSTKPCITSRDLALAYTPGVAIPCLEIEKDPENAYKYTSKGNLVAVVSNGTAVLGLGNIGALAGKPVMEGKGILFKRFADVDVFDIEVNESTVEGMVKVVKALEPTFGGINLEDIKAPECFEIEEQLIKLMDIPVFHDDQHGTAIIAAAGFVNAIEITGRKLNEVNVVFSGAGAASIACAYLFIELGVKKENIMLTDTVGVVYKGRIEKMNKYKEHFTVDTKCRTLADAMKGADAFIGCSAAGVLKKEMVATMADNPIIFAMANPTPEIFPDEVFSVRKDAIMATGRSDFPNQVNNVLGFPFIFRGALDVRAKKINTQMKLAAVKALADLAKEEVPEDVKMAYGNQDFSFGRNYIIPKPFDTRVLTRVTPAVAKAAMDSGVAGKMIPDLAEYAASLEGRLGTSASFMKRMRDTLSAKVSRLGRKVRVVYAEGVNSRILHAVSSLVHDGKIEPVLLGDREEIIAKIKKLSLPNLEGVEIINPVQASDYKDFAKEFGAERARRGVSSSYAKHLMTQSNYYGSMMLRHSKADAFISGPRLTYPECFAPIMQTLGTAGDVKSAGVFIMVFKNRVLFLSDCTAQVGPNAEDLAHIAISTANLFRKIMRREPRVAFLSFSSYGSNKHPKATMVKEAVGITKKLEPGMIVDGELQADVAVNKSILDHLFDFTELDGQTDILIFPDLNSANISYKLLSQLSDTAAIGPIIAPMRKAANIVQRTSTVTEIINMSTITAILHDEGV